MVTTRFAPLARLSVTGAFKSVNVAALDVPIRQQAV